MDTATSLSSSARLFDDAILSLMSQWPISSSAAVVALIQAAEDLGVAVTDLAALVYASDHQRRVGVRTARFPTSASAYVAPPTDPLARATL